MARNLDAIQDAVVEVHNDVAAASKAFLDRTRLEGLPRAKYARYNAHRADPLQGCLEGTRVDILEEIYIWANREDDQVPCVFWVHGLAGTGKSTLAYTVAERSERNGTLGASFFFSQEGAPELHDSALVLPTIAHQLAQFSYEYAGALADALAADSDAAYSSLENQWEKLIATPIKTSACNTNRNVVVVLDALDECDEAGCAKILESILTKHDLSSFRLKFFITTRPEAHIRSIFNRHHGSGHLQHYILHDVPDATIGNDIRLYLQSELSNIPVRLELALSDGWITEEELETLVRMAGKLFIFAATVARFIGDKRVLSPRDQLDIVLGSTGSASAQPYASLDALYHRLLQHAVSSNNEAFIVTRLRKLLGAIVGVEPSPPPSTLETLSGLPSGSALTSLQHLHSILIIPKDDKEAIKIYHPSFAEFIRDPMRCRDVRFQVDLKMADTQMALWCLTFMNSTLKKEALWGNAWNNDEISDLRAKFEATYPVALEYASHFFSENLKPSWLEHTSVKNALHDFASQRFLFWLEYLSYGADRRDPFRSFIVRSKIATWAVSNFQILIIYLC